jgi:hypothetical protein
MMRLAAIVSVALLQGCAALCGECDGGVAQAQRDQAADLGYCQSFSLEGPDLERCMYGRASLRQQAELALRARAAAAWAATATPAPTQCAVYQWTGTLASVDCR